MGKPTDISGLEERNDRCMLSLLLYQRWDKEVGVVENGFALYKEAKD